MSGAFNDDFPELLKAGHDPACGEYDSGVKMERCEDGYWFHYEEIEKNCLSKQRVKTQLAILKAGLEDFVQEALKRPQVQANPALRGFLERMRDDPVLLRHVVHIEKNLGIHPNDITVLPHNPLDGEQR